MGHVFLLFINVQFLLLEWALFSTKELESFESEWPTKKVLKKFSQFFHQHQWKPLKFHITIFFLRLFRHYVDFLSNCFSYYFVVVEENEILYLEGKYNKLRASSNSGRFDIELFRRLVSPPLPQTLTDSKLSPLSPSDCALQSML